MSLSDCSSIQTSPPACLFATVVDYDSMLQQLQEAERLYDILKQQYGDDPTKKSELKAIRRKISDLRKQVRKEKRKERRSNENNVDAQRQNEQVAPQLETSEQSDTPSAEESESTGTRTKSKSELRREKRRLERKLKELKQQQSTEGAEEPTTKGQQPPQIVDEAVKQQKIEELKRKVEELRKQKAEQQVLEEQQHQQEAEVEQKAKSEQREKLKRKLEELRRQQQDIGSAASPEPSPWKQDAASPSIEYTETDNGSEFRAKPGATETEKRLVRLKNKLRDLTAKKVEAAAPKKVTLPKMDDGPQCKEPSNSCELPDGMTPEIDWGTQVPTETEGLIKAKSASRLILSQHVRSDGYIYTDSSAAAHVPHECVALVQAIRSEVGPTGNWIPDSSVGPENPNLSAGTPIATFNSEKKYPGDTGYLPDGGDAHAAIFLGYYRNDQGLIEGMFVLDQYSRRDGKPAGVRALEFRKSPKYSSIIGG